MNGIWNKIIIISIFIVMLPGIVCYADGQKDTVLSAGKKEDKLVLYVKDPGADFEVACQIGTNDCESVSVSAISDESIPIETVFLVDNSLSVTEKYRPIITDILTQLAANRMSGEVFSVMTFSDKIECLIEKSSDYAQVKQAIDSITWQNQETYLTDILYDMLASMEKEEYMLRRIIIISDGVDNKEIGYTKEELYGLLENHICPIYTLGCTYKSNNEDLKNMFALSRATGGKSWLLDDVNNVMDIINGIGEMNDAKKIVIHPRKADCDGTTKGISLSLVGQEQTVQYTLEMTMPFIKENVMGTEIETIEETKDAAETKREDIQPIIRTRNSNLKATIIGGIAALVLSVTIIVFIIIQKRSNKNIFKPASKTNISDDGGEPKRKTHIVNREHSYIKTSSRKTHYAWGKKLQLTDQNDPKHYFEAYLNESHIIVGYNDECQICINYDESVSGNHCNIFEKNGKILVRNLSRTNPTILNGEQIEGDAELKRGDVLTLGNLNMKVGIDTWLYD